MEIFSTSTIQVATLSLILYYIALVVYRLYFSPIAKFPGPKIAASTLWYEFYYDVVKKGQYTWEIGKMHEKYGKLRSATSAGSCLHQYEAQSSVSILTSFTSTIRTTTTKCTQGMPAGRPNGPGQPECLAIASQASQQKVTSSTGSVVALWKTSSPSFQSGSSSQWYSLSSKS